MPTFLSSTCMDRKKFKPQLWANNFLHRSPEFPLVCICLKHAPNWTGVGSFSKACHLCYSTPTRDSQIHSPTSDSWAQRGNSKTKENTETNTEHTKRKMEKHWTCNPLVTSTPASSLLGITERHAKPFHLPSEKKTARITIYTGSLKKDGGGRNRLIVFFSFFKEDVLSVTILIQNWNGRQFLPRIL